MLSRLLTTFLMASGLVAPAVGVAQTSAKAPKTVLIELFTSHG